MLIGIGVVLALVAVFLYLTGRRRTLITAGNSGLLNNQSPGPANRWVCPALTKEAKTFTARASGRPVRNVIAARRGRSRFASALRSSRLASSHPPLVGRPAALRPAASEALPAGQLLWYPHWRPGVIMALLLCGVPEN